MSNSIITHKPFLFIRHGETNCNKEQRIMGSRNIPLNNRGVLQAESVIILIKHSKITHIVSSPLSRAKQTADIINNTLKVPITTNDDLKECNWGEAQGTIVEKSPVHLFLASGNPPAGGEAISAFKKRVLSAINTILDQDGLPLIIAHGGIYWAIMEDIGYVEQDAGNIVPHYFRPPLSGKEKWSVETIKI